jgi:hypothetical protein
MNFRVRSPLRLIIVYLVAIPVLSVSIEVAWGITHGLLSGVSLGDNPAFREELNKFLTEREIDLTGGERDIRARLKNKLSDEGQDALGAIFRKYEVVTFSSTFLASALAFGCIGFLTAIVTSSWTFVGLLTVVSFTLNNPVHRYGIIADMPFSEKFLVVLFAQFGASYLLAYLGAKLRIRRAKPPE